MKLKDLPPPLAAWLVEIEGFGGNRLMRVTDELFIQEQPAQDQIHRLLDWLNAAYEIGLAQVATAQEVKQAFVRWAREDGSDAGRDALVASIASAHIDAPSASASSPASPGAVSGEPVAWPDVDEFAQHIRWLNGNNKMGAGVLAERLLEWLKTRAGATPPSAPSAAQGAVIAEAAKWLHAAYDRPPQTPEARAMLSRIDALAASSAQRGEQILEIARRHAPQRLGMVDVPPWVIDFGRALLAAYSAQTRPTQEEQQHERQEVRPQQSERPSLQDDESSID